MEREVDSFGREPKLKDPIPSSREGTHFSWGWTEREYDQTESKISKCEQEESKKFGGDLPSIAGLGNHKTLNPKRDLELLRFKLSTINLTRL